MRADGVQLVTVLDRHMPRWKGDRAELSAVQLAHEGWSF
jgi:hypothetical protein